MNFKGQLLKSFPSSTRRATPPFFLMTVLMAEVGELADAVKKDEKESIAEELAEKYPEGNIKDIVVNWREPHLGGRAEKLGRG